jgi:hypothetical protein
MAFNTVTLVAGPRGSGKTALITGIKELDIEGLFDIYMAKDMKILIVDTIDHPSYRELGIPFITKEKLKLWKKGIYRIIINPYEIAEFCLLLNSLGSMYNTLVIWEDARKHTRRVVCKEMGTFIIDTKQKNIDMVFMYHSWMQAPDELYGMIDYIECFKVKSSPKKREKSMEGYYDEALEVWESVMNDPSRFAHKTIDCGN